MLFINYVTSVGEDGVYLGFKFGTTTPQDSKFSIYRDSLGFEDFSNFDGVRLVNAYF